MPSDFETPLPGQACQVLAADDIFVSHGVNAGDGLMGPEEVCPGDIYHLDDTRNPLRLIVTRSDGAGPRVGAGSCRGARGGRDPL